MLRLAVLRLVGLRWAVRFVALRWVFRFVALRLGLRRVVLEALLGPRFAVRAPSLDAPRVDFDLRERFGSLPPERRASDSPMATACLRLVTFLPDRPERSLPRFISCSARSTFLLAFGP